MKIGFYGFHGGMHANAALESSRLAVFSVQWRVRHGTGSDRSNNALRYLIKEHCCSLHQGPIGRMEFAMIQEYKGVKFSVGATCAGVGGTWSGEYAFYKERDGKLERASQYMLAPGDFNSEGDARVAALEHAKRLIDEDNIEN